MSQGQGEQESRARVALGLPVRDGQNFLRECLDSLLAQTWSDFELLISDNASVDDTEVICREYVARDSRVRYVRQAENLGAAGNFNYLVGATGGEFFKWVAHDDVLAPTWLERCVDLLDASDDETVLAYTRVRHLFQEEGRIQDYEPTFPWDAEDAPGRLEQMLLAPRESIITHCYPVFGLFRRATLTSTNRIQAFNSSDKVLLVELALRGAFAQSPEVLFTRRRHAGNSLAANSTEQAVLEWFDPRLGSRPAAPIYDLWRGYRRALREAPLDRAERRACSSVLRRWGWRRRRRILGQFLRRLGLRR